MNWKPYLIPAPGKMSKASMNALPTMPKTVSVPWATMVSTKASLEVIVVGWALHAGVSFSVLLKNDICVHNPHCGNFRGFLLLRFYIKSIIYVIVIFCHFRAWKFVELDNFSIQKVQKFIKIKIQCLLMCENVNFAPQEFHINFT